MMKLVGHLSSVMREACRPWICATLPMQPAAQSLRIALVEHFKHGGQHASDFFRDFLGANSRLDGVRRHLLGEFGGKGRIGLGIGWHIILHPFLQEFDAPSAHDGPMLVGAVRSIKVFHRSIFMYNQENVRPL
ncbi:mlr6748 [Mesorhizobium japonicum MAFF 303099]|uniref:Mlr6748 protein n=1 Tax=Mesorhizobium japonicum (strain LMG 29417 / CECT 9101 / MAFF 303099) TaxID=266835 RepID=Q988G7_RHILO|nr:mlr6748 [Mesorhizobium japonicum MAFF 303099]